MPFSNLLIRSIRVVLLFCAPLRLRVFFRRFAGSDFYGSGKEMIRKLPVDLFSTTKATWKFQFPSQNSLVA